MKGACQGSSPALSPRGTRCWSPPQPLSLPRHSPASDAFPQGCGGVRARGARVSIRGRGSVGVTPGCRSTAPRPTRCPPATSVPSPRNLHHPWGPSPPTAPSGARCHPPMPPPGARVGRWHSPGRGRGGTGGRAQRPRRGAGLAWPAGMAQRGRRKRREGWSCSQEVWTWSQLRKREKNKKKIPLIIFFFFFFLLCPETRGFWHSSTAGLLSQSTGWGGVCGDILVQPLSGVLVLEGVPCPRALWHPWVQGLTLRAGASEGTP